MRNFVFFKSLAVFLCLSGAFVLAQPVMSFGAVSEEHYSEVEVILDGQFSLSDIASLPRAPGSNLEVLDGGKRVKAQLPSEYVAALADSGADIDILRNFVLIEGGAEAASTDEDMFIDTVCPGDFVIDSNGSNPYITDGGNDYTAFSSIIIEGLPDGAEVTCMDIEGYGWIIEHDRPTDVRARLYNENKSIYYQLWNQQYADPGEFGELVWGITVFNGEPANQTWQIGAGDWVPGATGFIDYWCLKLYYVDFGGYCSANGEEYCWEYVERVQVGTINNYTGDECGGYKDFTSSDSTTMVSGVGYPIAVTIYEPDPDDRCGVWVDWNRDKDFYDAGETISMSGNPSAGYFTGTITPPAGTYSGPTRMRVRIQWDSGIYPPTPAVPCGVSDTGETEDYTIIVEGVEPPPAGDMDGDGDVDMFDVDELCEMWLTDDATCDIYPEGGDGIVDMGDFAVQAEDYGP